MFFLLQSEVQERVLKVNSVSDRINLLERKLEVCTAVIYRSLIFHEQLGLIIIIYYYTFMPYLNTFCLPRMWSSLLQC